MSTTDTQSEDLPATLGIDATPLESFAAVDTADGQLIVYDRDDEAGWIQSDLYVSRDAMI